MYLCVILLLATTYLVVESLEIKQRYKRDLDQDLKWEVVGQDVCFHGKEDSFGVLMLKKSGFLKAVKLVHKSGVIECSSTLRGSNWGCADHTSLNVFITDEKKHVLFPPKHEVTPTTGHWYKMPGSVSTSDELVFKNFCYPTYVRGWDHLQLWWGEDLINHASQNDNSGKSCVDVYGAFETPAKEFN